MCGRLRGTLEKGSEPLAAADVPSLRACTELARVHIFDHALAQRADSIGRHSKLLSEMRLMTPQSSRQDAPSAIDHLDPDYCAQISRLPPQAIAQRFSAVALRVS